MVEGTSILIQFYSKLVKSYNVDLLETCERFVHNIRTVLKILYQFGRWVSPFFEINLWSRNFWFSFSKIMIFLEDDFGRFF